MSKSQDLTGKTFGKWTVLRSTRKANIRRVLWSCVCECGLVRTRHRYDLTSGKSTQCRACSAKDQRTGTRAFRQVLSDYKCGAKRRGLIWTLSDEEFNTLSQNKCHYCGTGPSNTLTEPYDTFTYNGVDRKDNSLGYTLENSLPCCFECNMCKGTMEYDAFLAWINRVSNNEQEYGLSSC